MSARLINTLDSGIVFLAVNGCNMPMSITGRHGGSFRKHNPQISQTIESLKLICQQLNASPKKWWMPPSVMTSIEQMFKEKRQKMSQEDEDDDTIENDCEAFGEKNGQETSNDDLEKDKELMDLHSKSNDESARFVTTTKDHNDVDSIDSDDSLWNRGRKSQKKSRNGRRRRRNN
jgi:hypothetical protein